MNSIKELWRANQAIGRWLKWERDTLELFHEYAQRYGCGPGANVYLFVLRDALARRGLTVERFRASLKKESE